MDSAEVDYQHAVDEHERVVVAEELQLEGVVECEEVARFDGEPGVVVPTLCLWNPGAVRVLAEPRGRIDARREAGREDILVSLAVRPGAE